MGSWGKSGFAVCFALSVVAHATEQPDPGTASTAAPALSTAPATPTTPTTSAAPATSQEKAREALQQKEGDVSSQKNLEQVFQASEKNYSLIKAGQASLYYDFEYSYFRDDRIDIAIDPNSSNVTRFQVENDAQHSFGNTLSANYGVWDNLTFTASLPLVYKYDTQKDIQQAGLGDVSFGFRWQPVPVRRGLASSTIYGNFSTATGDSPYQINPNTDLASGKGYYSFGGGISMNKLMDPVVIFGSLGGTINLPAKGLDQNRGGRILHEVDPGPTASMSLGFAYSLSYDVSLTASYQHAYSLPTKFKFAGETPFETADQTSTVLNFSLGLRTSPKRIVNVNFGFGLSEDSPDVILGFSLPVEFAGFMTE